MLIILAIKLLYFLKNPLIFKISTRPSKKITQPRKYLENIRPEVKTSKSYEGRLRELGLFSLQKGRFWGLFIVFIQCLKRAYKKCRHLPGPVLTEQGAMSLN